jgi:hypothetical protein
MPNSTSAAQQMALGQQFGITSRMETHGWQPGRTHFVDEDELIPEKGAETAGRELDVEQPPTK